MRSPKLQPIEPFGMRMTFSNTLQGVTGPYAWSSDEVAFSCFAFWRCTPGTSSPRRLVPPQEESVTANPTFF